MDREFKNGEVVVCIDLYNCANPRSNETTITLGKVYTIMSVDNSAIAYPIMVINDIGETEYFSYNNFENLSVYRLGIINDILNGAGV